MSAASTMNVVIKNNRILLKKRTKRQWSLVSASKRLSTEYNLPQASTKQLKQLKKRLQSENRWYELKVIGLTVILAMALFAFVQWQLRLF